jgi:hypothetical protein
MASVINRKHWDMDTKAKVVKDVLDGKLTIEKACNTYNLQPYQLMAWVGQVQLSPTAKVTSAADTQKATAPDNPSIPMPSLDDFSGTDPDLARAIGEWYLRKCLITMVSGGKGPSTGGDKQ